MQSLRSEHRRCCIHKPAEHLFRVVDQRRSLPVRDDERRRHFQRSRRR
jgi:hypothetical protein